MYFPSEDALHSSAFSTDEANILLSQAQWRENPLSTAYPEMLKWRVLAKVWEARKSMSWGLLITLKLVLKGVCVTGSNEVHHCGRTNDNTFPVHAPCEALSQEGTGNVTIPRAFLPAMQEWSSPWFPQKRVGSTLIAFLQWRTLGSKNLKM